MRKTAVVLLTSLLLASLPVHGGHVANPGDTGDEMERVVHDCTSQPGPDNPEPGPGTVGNDIAAVFAGMGERVLVTGSDPEPLVLVQTVVTHATEPPPVSEDDPPTVARLDLTFEAGGTEVHSVVRSTDDWETNIAPVTPGEDDDFLSPDWSDVREGLASTSPSVESYSIIEVGYRPYRILDASDLSLKAFVAVTSYEGNEVDTTEPPTGGCEGHVVNDTEYERPEPEVLGITFTPASPDRTKAVEFTPVLDPAGGDPDFINATGYSFTWTFTNGDSDPQSSTEARPTRTFTEFAPVTVTLQFTNDLGALSDVASFPNLVTFHNLAPVSDFTVSPRAPEVDETVTFTDETTDPEGDAIESWSWDFGDGATSTDQDPTHAYTEVGAYEVTLTTTDEHDGSDTRSLTLFVCDEADQSEQVCRPPNVGPQASFETDTNHVEQGETVTFTDASTDPDGSIAAWHWDFGDGGEATTQNPTHVFEEVGTFQVTLTVTDDEGLQATRTAPVRVVLAEPDDDGDDQVLLPAPLAAFLVEPGTPVVGKPVTFTDDTTAETELVSWTWFFGDGSSVGSGSEVSHTYQETGTFRVSLTVADERGVRDTTSRTIVVASDAGGEDAPGLPVGVFLAALAVAVARRRR